MIASEMFSFVASTATLSFPWSFSVVLMLSSKPPRTK